MKTKNPYLEGLLWTWIGFGLVGLATLLLGQAVAGLMMIGTGLLGLVVWLGCEAIAYQLAHQKMPAENKV